MAERTREELERALRKHLNFIQRSCQWYDEGWIEEAERIAVSLRVLFHTTEQATSLVDQMGMNRIRLHSTRTDVTDEGRVHLVRFAPERGSIMVRPFKSEGCTFERVSLLRWWTEETVVIPNTPDLKRRDLVLSLANKDGAHIDPKLSEEDRAMRTMGAMEWRIQLECGPVKEGTFEDSLHVCVRQIAHEVLATPAMKPWIGNAL